MENRLLNMIKEIGNTPKGLLKIRNTEFTEEEQLEVVKKDGWMIKYINNPSESVQLESVKNAADAIKYINNPSEKIQLESVKNDGSVIRYIHNPSELVQLKAVKSYGAIKYRSEERRVGKEC